MQHADAAARAVAVGAAAVATNATTFAAQDPGPRAVAAAHAAAVRQLLR